MVASKIPGVLGGLPKNTDSGNGFKFHTPGVLTEDPFKSNDGPRYKLNQVTGNWEKECAYSDPDMCNTTKSAYEVFWNKQKKYWPVPGHTTLNVKNKPGEGSGKYRSSRTRGRHSGIDIEAPKGTNVVAFRAGKVMNIRPNPSKTYGKQIVLSHGFGVYSQSAHLDSTSVSPGQYVLGGGVIGTVGRTGNTPKQGDTHLHFEIRIGSMRPKRAGGKVADPMKYLPVP